MPANFVVLPARAMCVVLILWRCEATPGVDPGARKRSTPSNGLLCAVARPPGSARGAGGLANAHVLSSDQTQMVRIAVDIGQRCMGRRIYGLLHHCLPISAGFTTRRPCRQRASLCAPASFRTHMRLPVDRRQLPLLDGVVNAHEEPVLLIFAVGLEPAGPGRRSGLAKILVDQAVVGSSRRKL
jgi:hypothetical protein